MTEKRWIGGNSKRGFEERRSPKDDRTSVDWREFQICVSRVAESRHSTAFLVVPHGCRERLKQCQVRWGWSSDRRRNLRISMTSIERPVKPTKIDLIAGILLIFVCDMLLLSFTF
ncbi:unnamed protein product [Heligmosomoides polygyrus]|uniref:Uncharacterized protein n=1 Tax=Heligmosomoides polygyrus TaxID=6339 RepID=A0A183FZB6_HELPZ|nr:unnamed protein product [Heligmosomoides polygyrus]